MVTRVARAFVPQKMGSKPTESENREASILCECEGRLMPTSAEGNFGKDVKARNNETTVAYVQHPSSTPPQGRQGRKTEVPRSNNLERNSQVSLSIL